MATDVEESDTDERPAKRIKLGQSNRIVMDPCSAEMQVPVNNMGAQEEEEEMERLARERLKKWQACQVAKGFVDNTINCVLENHVVMQSFDNVHSRETSPANEMEDHAVTMAILNHGLVQATDVIADPCCPNLNNCHANNYWIDKNRTQVDCTCTNEMELDVPGPAHPLNARIETKKPEDDHDYWLPEKCDDSNQQQDFLERAVAEAIKKKGLSALSVDYG